MNTDIQITKTPSTKKLKRFTAIFGGTFDPIHNAHLALAQEVIALDLVDEVMFVPAAKPPHKLNKKITPANHRLEMLRLVLEDNPAFALSDYEVVNNKRTSFTINTLRAMQTAFPERRFKLIIGMDNFREMDQWHRYQEIINNFDLIIFCRPGVIKPSTGQILEKFGSKATDFLENSIIENIKMEISSTAIRKRATNGEDISDLVPYKVAKYIQENNIYTNHE
jgi:nicotinate-nucleotide adenylyltransferase